MRAWRVGPVPSEVTVADVKANARIDYDDEDWQVQQAIDAAHVRAEEETGRVFGVGEWIIEADADDDRLCAPIWPITAAPEGWTMETTGRRTVLVAGEWPADRRITVTAGEPMPLTVRQAVLMLATYWLAQQRSLGSVEPMKEVPYAVTSLLGLNRRMFV